VRYLKTQVPLWIALRTASTAALATADNSTTHDLTHTGIGHSALVVFLLAHLVVMAEEFTHLRKSKPAILAAGVIDPDPHGGQFRGVPAAPGGVNGISEARRLLLEPAPHAGAVVCPVDRIQPGGMRHEFLGTCLDHP
jgi:hypothetical protein